MKDSPGQISLKFPMHVKKWNSIIGLLLNSKVGLHAVWIGDASPFYRRAHMPNKQIVEEVFFFEKRKQKFQMVKSMAYPSAWHALFAAFFLRLNYVELWAKLWGLSCSEFWIPLSHSVSCIAVLTFKITLNLKPIQSIWTML